MASRKIARADLTVESLKKHLRYDPETGRFARLIGKRNHVNREQAGSIGPNGYRRIKINDTYYAASRLAWLYTTGRWPEDQIDHINGNPGDNRLCNLREATCEENLRNRGIHKRNTSGFKGVCWNKRSRKWQASIGANGKLRHLGLHDTAEQAHEAYCLAAHLLHGDFANRGDFS